VQLTFSDGNCCSSIYLLAFHLCFVSKTLSFCLQSTCVHVCCTAHFFNVSTVVARPTECLTLCIRVFIATESPPLTPSLKNPRRQSSERRTSVSGDQVLSRCDVCERSQVVSRQTLPAYSNPIALAPFRQTTCKFDETQG